MAESLVWNQSNDANGIIVDLPGAFDHQGNGITGTQSGGIRVAIFKTTRQLYLALMVLSLVLPTVILAT
ncbi:MAG: hypothetical protein WKF59_25240 [Chitinophagaceae bacterium]